MNLALKGYQTRILGTLREYLREVARTGDPRNPFEKIVAANAAKAVPYIPVQIPGLAGVMPYVCLRVPTGGGKTLLAAHAIGSAVKDYQRGERAVVLWFVPSNPILDQTLAALKNPRHPYRHALERGDGAASPGVGAVEVLTIEEALRVTPATLDGTTVVIVATIQGFRVDDTTGRKVFDPMNGQLDEHFRVVPPDRVASLEKGPDGKPARSLENVLRLRRPIVIVDEAHNVRTPLSFTTLGKLQPSCILEFTATPDREKAPSNVLHRVSAAELKAAAMIKLPIRVVTRPAGEWARLLAEALTLRKDLETIAGREGQATGEYLRPIALIQARDVDHTVELRKHLETEHGIPATEIKICTAKLDELKDVRDLAAPDCPVRYILTVQKLREGWDCPFAYVLCSLQETRSATAIEQIVGRVLRLPKASFKKEPALNEAYVFSISPTLAEVLGELKGALELHGFTGTEAEKLIISGGEGGGTLPLLAQPVVVAIHPEDFDTTLVAAHAPALLGKVSFDVKAGTLTVQAPLTETEKAWAVSCVKEPAMQAQVTAAATAVAEEVAAWGSGGKIATNQNGMQQSIVFRVPLLAIRQGDLLEPFEATHLLERPWRLSERDASLSEVLYPAKRSTGELGLVDVDQTSGRVSTEKTDTLEEGDDKDFVGRLHQHVMALTGGSDWSFEHLIVWLDKNLFRDPEERREIIGTESALFLRKAINGLIAARGLTDIGGLVLDRHRLAEALAQRIRQHREAERHAAFQSLLLPESELTVSDEVTLDLATTRYEPSWLYDGGHKFTKHYYAPAPGELHSNGEEFECAVYLDGLSEVKTWVRNLSKKGPFWLRRSTANFYPDFVCLLTDGRILAVEYKGAHLVTADEAKEKAAVGAVWASRSGGKCLFVMPAGKDLAAIKSAIAKL
ncbi:MAG: DEAD/DEAH box helicase family protein [Verrucomicrobia bacterium]|nr:DEAD/DEAH box helicase family protein [Verrucomicrobiota bacterium]